MKQYRLKYVSVECIWLSNKRRHQNDLILFFVAPLKKFRVIPLHLMYRPANTVPYASVETDLKGVFLKYCLMDRTGRLIARTTSEVEQKCCAFQHWIHQWTNGNILVTRLEGKEKFTSTLQLDMYVA